MQSKIVYKFNTNKLILYKFNLILIKFFFEINKLFSHFKDHERVVVGSDLG